MISDAENNFYVFSASGNVFKVMTKELKAKFVGKVTGIPENYSVNGSAVNAAGRVVVASAKGAPLYEVDLKTLIAKQLPGNLNLPIYDLASQYFANDKGVKGNVLSKLDVFPTRVDDGVINIMGNDKTIKGNLSLMILDMSGKNVLKQNLAVKDGSVSQQINLGNLVNGTYIVNITDHSGKAILSKKIIVND
ncbi:T9SS type A sorting domain-containing protein [Chryseobacterium piperi]|uniref:T9SS type A sorting domain-containing protein n=1 Tax=Chryseobacterium piperi TaxID=558152 RepID=UPI001E4CA547|nr:T9SS type A sorting domain-containing protein [Chryseobacterium piperi]